MKPQFPLVFSTLCQRISMGAYTLGMVAVYLFGMDIALGWLALISLVILGIGMLGSMTHLGKPARFLNTFSNMKSHLAQEGLLVFIIGVLYIVVGIDGWLVSFPAGATIAVRVLALAASLAFISVTALAYHMPARPAWKSYATPITFLLTWLSTGSISVVAWAAITQVPVDTGFLYLTAALMIIALAGQAYYTFYVGRIGYKIDVRPLSEEFKNVYVSWLIIGAIIPILIVTLMLFLGVTSLLAVALFFVNAIGLCIWQAFFFMCGKEIWFFSQYEKNMSPNF